MGVPGAEGGGPRGGEPALTRALPWLALPLTSRCSLEDHGESAVPNQVLARELELAHGLQAAAAGSMARTGANRPGLRHGGTDRKGAVGRGAPVGQPGMRTRFDSNPVSTRVQTLASGSTRAPAGNKRAAAARARATETPRKRVRRQVGLESGGRSVQEGAGTGAVWPGRAGPGRRPALSKVVAPVVGQGHSGRSLIGGGTYRMVRRGQ